MNRRNPKLASDSREPSRQQHSTGVFSRRNFIRWVRPAFWVFAIGLGTLLAASSWMKWFDLVVDSGPQVYIPWRITLGEQLGRDIVHPYGPLSSYFNAGLFTLFGVSIRTLAIANIIIYAAITLLAFRVLRSAFGFAPAAVSTTFGIAVFGFGQHTYTANYNFAMPYSHEATHGMLLLLALLAWLIRPIPRFNSSSGIVAGMITGLLWLTKTEYIAASVVVLIVTVIRIQIVGNRRESWIWLVETTSAAIATLAIGWLFLAPHTGAKMAFRTITSAPLAPWYYASYAQSRHVLQFIGLDEPIKNLANVARWSTAASIFVITFHWTLRQTRGGTRTWIIALAVTAAFSAWCWTVYGWTYFGAMMPGLVLAAALIGIQRTPVTNSLRAQLTQPRNFARSIFLCAGIAMLARMALVPKLSHYGFFQAYLASLWTVAALCAASLAAQKNRLSLQPELAFYIVAAATIAGTAIRNSQNWYQYRTVAVGTGADRIYSLQRDFGTFPEAYERIRGYIDANTRPDQSILVVPEGITLNYWTRRKHPLHITNLLADTLPLEPGNILDALKSAAPEVVVFATRIEPTDQETFSYGMETTTVQAIIRWVAQDYMLVAKSGASPFEKGKLGVEVWRKKTR